jgi:hypothetical protein
MFISAKLLHEKMGVDEEIARFFVDRKVPIDNVFWEKRRLYVNRGNGYLSIPVYYDLIFRSGVSKTILLADGHIQCMERIMHYAIQVEYKQISFNTQLEQITKLLEGRIKNPQFYLELVDYLLQPVLNPKGNLGRAVPALNRADVFLFILCDLPLSRQATEDAVQYWYALHTTYLLMDDIYDYRLDKQDREENSVMELGNGKAGYDKAFDILHSNTHLLQQINPVLSQYFGQAVEELKELSVTTF